jgi:hypothetical protein
VIGFACRLCAIFGSRLRAECAAVSRNWRVWLWATGDGNGGGFVLPENISVSESTGSMASVAFESQNTILLLRRHCIVRLVGCSTIVQVTCYGASGSG